MKYIPIAKPQMGPLEISEAVRVLDSGVLAGGPENLRFEKAWAEWQHREHAVAVTNGTSALELALEALSSDERTDVIVPAFSFNATSSAVIAVGYNPVFVDVDPDTYTMDPTAVKRALTRKTRAILPVHLYGLMADMDELDAIAEDAGVPIIEDAAQAHDSGFEDIRPGGWTTSIAQCYSFYATKNITTGGEGGAVTTDDSVFAETLGLIREHGAIQKYHHILPGHNFRMTEMQAAIGTAQLETLPYWQEVRRYNARTIRTGLAGFVDMQIVPAGNLHSWHQLVIEVQASRRDRIREYLHEHGIGTSVPYPTADPRQPMYRYPEHSFPVAENLASRVLSLPVGPWVYASEAEYIVDITKEALRCA